MFDQIIIILKLSTGLAVFSFQWTIWLDSHIWHSVEQSWFTSPNKFFTHIFGNFWNPFLNFFKAEKTKGEVSTVIVHFNGFFLAENALFVVSPFNFLVTLHSPIVLEYPIVSSKAWFLCVEYCIFLEYFKLKNEKDEDNASQ